mgnify:CR=1 FL=1
MIETRKLKSYFMIMNLLIGMIAFSGMLSAQSVTCPDGNCPPAPTPPQELTPQTMCREEGQREGIWLQSGKPRNED